MLLAGPQFAWKMAPRGLLAPLPEGPDRAPRGEDVGRHAWWPPPGAAGTRGLHSSAGLHAVAPGPHTEPRAGPGTAAAPVGSWGWPGRSGRSLGHEGGRALAGMRAPTCQAACSWSVSSFRPGGRELEATAFQGWGRGGPCGGRLGPTLVPLHPRPSCTSSFEARPPSLQNGTCPQGAGETRQLTAEVSPEVTPLPMHRGRRNRLTTQPPGPLVGRNGL